MRERRGRVLRQGWEAPQWRRGGTRSGQSGELAKEIGLSSGMGNSWRAQIYHSIAWRLKLGAKMALGKQGSKKNWGVVFEPR